MDAFQERYSRQIRFPQLGETGQRNLQGSGVLLIGCGALGSVIANTLVRAGVGFLRLVDRDFLEWSNLQRQVLYTEADVQQRLPKAVAAAEHLRAINSGVTCEAVIQDVDYRNIDSLADGVDVILDGSDNFEIRFLINDFSVSRGLPWVYGGCLGAEGQTMTILPGETACLNCLMLEGPPPPGTTPTCDAAGVLSPIINLIASIQAMEAIKILSGQVEAVSRKLQMFSLWDNRHRQMDLRQLREQVDCPTCKQHRFEWLQGVRSSQSEVLCGREAVQIRPSESAELDLSSLANRWCELGEVQANEYLVRVKQESLEMTVFADGRAVVSGTDDPAVARKFYAQMLGH